MDFISYEELETLRGTDAAGCLKKFNEVLTRVYSKAVEDAIRSLPEAVGSLSKHIKKVNDLKKEFYQLNDELVNHKELVGKLIEQEELTNPGLPYDKLLEKVVPKAKQKVKELTLFKNEVPAKNPGQPKLSEDFHGVL